jgi:hypothetical protein
MAERRGAVGKFSCANLELYSNEDGTATFRQPFCAQAGFRRADKIVLFMEPFNKG